MARARCAGWPAALSAPGGGNLASRHRAGRGGAGVHMKWECSGSAVFQHGKTPPPQQPQQGREADAVCPGTSLLPHALHPSLPVPCGIPLWNSRVAPGPQPQQPLLAHTPWAVHVPKVADPLPGCLEHLWPRHRRRRHTPAGPLLLGRPRIVPLLGGAPASCGRGVVVAATQAAAAAADDTACPGVPRTRARAAASGAAGAPPRYVLLLRRQASVLAGAGAATATTLPKRAVNLTAPSHTPPRRRHARPWGVGIGSIGPCDWGRRRRCRRWRRRRARLVQGREARAAEHDVRLRARAGRLVRGVNHPRPSDGGVRGRAANQRVGRRAGAGGGGRAQGLLLLLLRAAACSPACSTHHPVGKRAEAKGRGGIGGAGLGRGMRCVGVGSQGAVKKTMRQQCRVVVVVVEWGGPYLARHQPGSTARKACLDMQQQRLGQCRNVQRRTWNGLDTLLPRTCMHACSDI